MHRTMVMVFTRRHWIPPGALLFAQLSHGASWPILALGALSASAWSLGFYAIAWIHTVALGWATMAALAVLLHVVPQFTDVRWRYENLARRSVFAFALGVALFVAALLLRPSAIAWGAALTLLAVLGYAFAAFATLARALNGERLERAIARALGTTLLFLVLTALAGFALAAAIAGYPVPAWMASLPATHASLGMFGWLSLLVFGVSARTVRPITGDKSRFRGAHIAVGSLALVGVALLAIGLAGVPPLVWPGAGLLGVAVDIYAFDMVDVVRRATVPHRVPQAFLLAGVTWLVCGAVLGAGTLAGKPWELAYGFVILAGWIGQMVDAHVYHIGVRLLLTIYLGDDDETRPERVLDGRLSWFSFGAFQIAIASAAIGLLTHAAALLCAGAAFGLLGWLAMMLNLVAARNAARALAA
ncbi:MAG TPA: hypothetical protein VGF86_06270 [Candidatus Tumulicola sp.]